MTVRETIPDRIVDEADEVELVDISPEALQERLKRGEIYPPDRAQAAINNFFRKGNLAALRELALRRVAQEVEDHIQEYLDDHGMDSTWPTQARVMVAIDHRPLSRQVLRAAALLAQGQRAELLAVTVGDPERLKPNDRQALEANQRLAEDLGATCHTVPGRDVAGALARFACEHHATQVVIGQSARGRLDILLRGSKINRLLREARDVDVHVVADRTKPR